jgi:hypothetical protein
VNTEQHSVVSTEFARCLVDLNEFQVNSMSFQEIEIIRKALNSASSDKIALFVTGHLINVCYTGYHLCCRRLYVHTGRV